MGATRDQLHVLVDQLPEEQLGPVLALVRGRLNRRRMDALATLSKLQTRMAGVSGADEELDRLRDGERG